MPLFPWQDYVIEHALGRRKNGKWAAQEVVTEVPRQNGKGEIIIARELLGMFLFREKKIIHTAHEFKTAKEGLLKLSAYITQNPELDALVDIKTGNTDPGVYWKLKRGQKQPERSIQFLARSGGSGRGFTADTLIYDEAFAVSPDMVAASGPTMAQVPNGQTWWMSSAGFAYSTELRARRERAKDGDSAGLAYFGWCVDEDDFDAGDPREWLRANPSIGYGYMSLEFFDQQYRNYKRSDNVAAFAREHLGVWDMHAANSELPESKWRRACVPASEIEGDRIVVSVDVSAARRASVAVTGSTADGGFQSEVVFNDEVGPEVVSVVKRLCSHWDVLGVVLDASGPAGQWLGALGEAGVEVKALGTRQVAQADGGFKEKVLAGRFVHRGQEILDQAALCSVAKRAGDLWVFDRSSELADMTPLKAVSLGVSHFEFLIGETVRGLATSSESWVW